MEVGGDLPWLTVHSNIQYKVYTENTVDFGIQIESDCMKNAENMDL